MSTYWTVRTRYGPFFIIPVGGRFEVRFEDEVLGSYHSLASAPYHESVWGMSHSAQRGGMAIRR
jgi:hypothetical protein